ncbi:MAG: hypothetical protein HOP30_09880 [Cyclobacteriaceae bacterium]|nr:hypothetical protein [Cyclobacteriaceae bacterium]
MKTLKSIVATFIAMLFLQVYSVAQSASRYCDSCRVVCKKSCKDCNKPDKKSDSLLIYDFKYKTLYKNSVKKDSRIKKLSKLRFRYNQEYKFKIIHINRYLYDVNFEAGDVQINNEPSPLFKNLFLGEGSIDTLIAGLEGISTATAKSDPSNSAPSAVKTFINSFKEFKGKYDVLLDDKVTVYSYCLPKLASACKDSTFSELSSSLLQAKLDYANAKKELEKQKSHFEQCKKENTEKKENKDKQVNEADCGVKVTEEEVKQIDQLGAYLDSIKEESLMSIILFHNSMVADHLEFTSSPIFPQGNRLRLGIGFNPTTSAKQLNFMPLPSDSIGLDIPIILKPFLTFSSGLFYSYIPQDSYGTKQMPFKGIVSDTSRFSIVKTGSRDATAGFSAFANLGMKFTGNFGAGVSLGVGVTIEDTPKPAYLAGLSTYWGDRKQLNFTFGLSAIPTRSLKTEIYPDLGTLLYKTAPS